MKEFVLIISCVISIASLLAAIKQIKEKKPITDPYLILSIITFLLALRMVGRILGG